MNTHTAAEQIEAFVINYMKKYIIEMGESLDDFDFDAPEKPQEVKEMVGLLSAYAASLSAPASQTEGVELAELTEIMREADLHFEQAGGGTRHYLRDCFLPLLQQRGIYIVRAAAPVSQPAPVLNTTMYGVCRNPSCLSCKGTGEMPVASPTTNEIHYHYCYGSFFAPVPHRTESSQPAPAEGEAAPEDWKGMPQDLLQEIQAHISSWERPKGTSQNYGATEIGFIQGADWMYERLQSQLKEAQAEGKNADERAAFYAERTDFLFAKNREQAAQLQQAEARIKELEDWLNEQKENCQKEYVKAESQDEKDTWAIENFCYSLVLSEIKTLQQQLKEAKG